VEESKVKEPIAVRFDERKDKSKVEVGMGIKGSKRFDMKKVENCAVISWPGEEFVGHVVPRDGTGAGLEQDIVQFFEDRATTLNSLRAILMSCLPSCHLSFLVTDGLQFSRSK
jgi:hypothetical protein